VKGFTTTIFRGDRIGIIGANGTGKTTLLRVLLGELAITKGSIRLGTNVQCAYFDQLHGQLEPDKPVYENIGQGYDTVTVNGRSRQVISYLKDFMFTAEKTRSLVANLSGGERNRLQIAKVFTQPCNVLVFDEPTNDLDVETLELLEEMLIEFNGTVLLVSHDRAFLNNVVTSMFVLEGNGEVKEYAGDYDSWLKQKEQSQPAQPKSAERIKKEKPKNQNSAKLNNKQRKELEELPLIIDRLEKQIDSLHQKMTQPCFYKQDAAIIADAKVNLEKCEADLKAAYERWESLEV
jgi:ATP-binding cassette subfamily F protein uup